MFTVREKIFNLFGSYEKSVDINKDANDKGTYERFVEVCGKQIDELCTPLVEDLVANNIDPLTAYLKYYIYLEYTRGIGLNLYDTQEWRKRVLKYIHRWYEIRSTKRCYTLMFKMIGLDVVITEYFGTYGFDSPMTFDDDLRVFDLKCSPCSSYDLTLTGTVPPSAELDNAINEIIIFNQPINGKLTNWTYNGVVGSILGSYDDSFNDDFY